MKQYLDRWGLEWFSKSRLDGVTRHLIFDNYQPAFFNTRKEAREFANKEYGYIKTRKDLRIEPHCWRIPKPVKIVYVFYQSKGGRI